MFEQAFKNIDDVLWKDAGCTSELDYTEQTSWLLFLKYLDALEADSHLRRRMVLSKSRSEEMEDADEGQEFLLGYRGLYHRCGVSCIRLWAMVPVHEEHARCWRHSLHG